jgi:hypothetical protein
LRVIGLFHGDADLSKVGGDYTQGTPKNE